MARTKKAQFTFNETTHALNTLGVSVVDLIRVRDKARKNLSREQFQMMCGEIMDGKIYVTVVFYGEVK